MDFALALKFNENHDPETGRFTTGGLGAFAGVSSRHQFAARSRELHKAQTVPEWEGYWGDQPGPGTYFGTRDSFMVNAYLRDRKSDTPDGKITQDLYDRAQVISDSFGKYGVTVSEGTEVYRALGGGFAESMDRLKEGDTYRDNGFVSTTVLDPDTSNFGNAILQITTKGSHRVLTYARESELLFEPGRRFTYHGKSAGHGRDKDLTFYRVTMD